MRIAFFALLASLAPIMQAQAQARPPGCAFYGMDFPANLRVYAAGGYNGRTLDFQIDQSGHTATQFDVSVNSTHYPVALMLGAYEPTVWSISRTRKTKILAVFVSGYHRQVLAGLDEGVLVINSTYDNQGACGHAFVGTSRIESLHPLARKLFNRDVDQLYPGDKDGRIAIGAPVYSKFDLVTSTRTPPDSFRDRSAPLAGEAGLEQAVRNGQLRPATQADLKAWRIARGEKLPPGMEAGYQARDSQVLRSQYVVLKEFTFPAGLYGAHSAMFFVPRGVPRPSGNPGHSSVYDYNALGCSGPMCPEFRAETASVRAAPSSKHGANAGPANPGASPPVLSLDNALETGAIRLATRADVDAWQLRAGAGGYARPRTFNTYVVLKPISFPPGSSTEDAASFIVPSGIQPPHGVQGQATVFDHNTLKCKGPKCH